MISAATMYAICRLVGLAAQSRDHASCHLDASDKEHFLPAHSSCIVIELSMALSIPALKVLVSVSVIADR
jgi:hypothetical protein